MEGVATPTWFSRPSFMSNPSASARWHLRLAALEDEAIPLLHPGFGELPVARIDDIERGVLLDVRHMTLDVGVAEQDVREPRLAVIGEADRPRRNGTGRRQLG